MKEGEGASPPSPPPLSSAIASPPSPPHNPSLSEANEEVIRENGEDHEEEIASSGDGALSDELRARIVRQVRDSICLFFLFCFVLECHSRFVLVFSISNLKQWVGCKLPKFTGVYSTLLECLDCSVQRELFMGFYNCSFFFPLSSFSPK